MPPIPAEVPARRFPDDRLHHLIVRIAAADRSAFRTFYALLAAGVWRDAIRMLPPADARAATRSTFIEIWHLAGHHLDHHDEEIRTWVLGVTAGHIDDRVRSADGQVAYRSSYDQHTHGELVALLGIGRPADI